MTNESENVLEVKDLRTYFFTQRGLGKAVDGVSFVLRRGETLGLVGESGSGKSITALSIIGLNPRPASEVVGGQALFHGEDLLRKHPREMPSYRGKRIAMVLQDPVTALNPVLTIGSQIAETIKAHLQMRTMAIRTRAQDLLRLLRVPDPEARLESYPHQLSGGMRQRAVGAVALSASPEVLIADEPTTSLDVTLQAAYLDLLQELQEELGLAILFITHDFGIVGRLCDRVAVMYAGKIVETTDVETLFDRPAHPYTQALLRSVPDATKDVDELKSIEGQPPSIYDIPVGCAFAPRCPYVHEPCLREYPPEFVLEDGHLASCWKYNGTQRQTPC